MGWETLLYRNSKEKSHADYAVTEPSERGKVYLTIRQRCNYWTLWGSFISCLSKGTVIKEPTPFYITPQDMALVLTYLHYWGFISSDSWLLRATSYSDIFPAMLGNFTFLHLKVYSPPKYMGWGIPAQQQLFPLPHSGSRNTDSLCICRKKVPLLSPTPLPWNENVTRLPFWHQDAKKIADVIETITKYFKKNCKSGIYLLTEVIPRVVLGFWDNDTLQSGKLYA